MDEHSSRRPRKADLRQHVGDEALAAQHDEVARDAREQRDQGAGDERVLHEVELQQQLQVGEQIPRQTLFGHSQVARCAWWLTGSCWPTTTKRPSLVRSTSTGAP